MFLFLVVKLKVSTYSGRPLASLDQEKMLEVSVVQQARSSWGWMGMDLEDHLVRSNSSGPPWVRPTETSPTDLVFPVPADGVVPLQIEVHSQTQVLTIDVSFLQR